MLPLITRKVQSPDGKSWRVSVRWFPKKRLWRKAQQVTEFPLDMMIQLPLESMSSSSADAGASTFADATSVVPSDIYVGSEGDGVSAAVDAGSGGDFGFDLDLGELGALFVIVALVILLVWMMPFVAIGIELLLVLLLAAASGMLACVGLRPWTIEIEPIGHNGRRYVDRKRGLRGAEGRMREIAQAIEAGAI